MSTAAVSLEQYLDSLDKLPDSVREKFVQIRELDEQSIHSHQTGEKLKTQLFKDLKNGVKMSDNEKKERITSIQHYYRKCNTIADEKVALASQAYEMIDKHIRKLDNELARFEGELKQQQLDHSDPSAAAAALGDKKKRKTGSTNDADRTDRKKYKHKEGGRPPTPPILGLPSIIGASVDVMDMPVDPNEPTYCICHQVSYGEMIGCDNNECPIEWFHFPCVGLSAKPKGKWYCQKCSAERKLKK